jgi:predicted MFS family arabinose efflux permease
MGNLRPGIGKPVDARDGLPRQARSVLPDPKGSPVSGRAVRPVQAARAQPILTRRLVLLLVVAVCALGSFYLLLSVVPLYVADGGAGGVGAGLSTGAMMVSTVLAELVVSHLVARFGYRVALAAALVLLGVPALALASSPALALVLAACLARGVGLGIVVVVGSALTAELAPASRRAEALGLYGVAVGIPAIVGLPAGLWLSEHFGFPPVFGAAGLLALVALAAVPAQPARAARTEQGDEGGDSIGGVLAALRVPQIVRPTLIFAAVTFAAGVFVTFLPLAVPGRSRRLVMVALLVQACTAPLARWCAGRFAARHGSSRLLVPAVLASAVGTAAIVWAAQPLAVIVGSGLFGVGFGLAQNATLALMLERVQASQFGRISALWNLAYDGGMGIGAVGFGLLAAAVGYPVGFALTATVLVAALLPARRDSTAACRSATE